MSICPYDSIIPEGYGEEETAKALKFITKINRHRYNVTRTWWNILRPMIVEEKISFHLSEINLSKIDVAISKHDLSLFEEEELMSLSEFANYAVVSRETFHWVNPDIGKALRHHFFVNPHHWQHWVNILDSRTESAPEMYADRMPSWAVIPMVVDWHAAGVPAVNALTREGHAAKDKSAYLFYHNHRDMIILHPETRAVVEQLVDVLKEPLPEEDIRATST